MTFSSPSLARRQAIEFAWNVGSEWSVGPDWGVGSGWIVSSSWNIGSGWSVGSDLPGDPLIVALWVFDFEPVITEVDQALKRFDHIMRNLNSSVFGREAKWAPRTPPPEARTLASVSEGAVVAIGCVWV